MADTHSFDITTGCDLQEVDNAINQASKELTQRYDFKGVSFTLEFKRTDKQLVITAPDDVRLTAIWDIVQTKMLRRGVPIQNLKRGDVQKVGGMTIKQEITLQQGIETEVAKEIVKFIKEAKLKKVQASIQSEQVRVSGPSRDELQQAMQILRAHDFGIQLTFGNYR